MNLSCARSHLAASLMAMTWLLSACGGRSSDPAPPATPIPDSVTVSATAAVTEIGDANTFTNSAATVGGLTFAWNFGDGVTSTEANPKHSYAKAGDFDVTLKVSNAAGASKDVKFKVAVNNRELINGLGCAGDTQAGWCWQAPRPTANGVKDIYFLSAQVGWTVGNQGGIHKTVDGGKTWTRQPSGVTKDLKRIRFADANNGWVLGDAGTVLHTSDAGVHWSRQSEGFWNSGDGVQLIVVSPAVVVIQGVDSKFQATTDGGSTWAQRFGATPLAFPSTVAADGTLWALNNDGLRKTTDFGATWVLVRPFGNGGTMPSLLVRGQRVWMLFRTEPTPGDVKYALQRSADAGATWDEFTPAGLPAGINGSTLDFLDANVGTVATDGNLYRTADGGRTWTLAANALDNVSASAVYANVAPGVVRRSYWSNLQKQAHQLSEDAGATWHAIAPPAFADGWWPSDVAVQRFDAQTWIVLSSSQSAPDQVSVSTDGMRTWSGVAGGLTRNFRGLWFFDAKRGVALTTDGELVETSNGGRDWAVKLAGLPKIPVAGFPARLPATDRIRFVDAKYGWLLAGSSQFHQTQDGGVTWQAQAPLSNEILNFQFIDANNGFAIGFGQDLKRKLLATTDAGKTWTPLSELPDAARVLHFSDALHGVVAGDSGRILSTGDGGKTWVTRREGDPRSRLLSVTSNEAASFWAVGSDGVVLNSRDNGVTWAQATVNSTALLHKIRFIDALQGRAVGSGGTVLATKDGGKTWSSQYTGTNVEMIDAFFLDSRSGWVVGRAGTEVYEYGTLMVTGTGGQ